MKIKLLLLTILIALAVLGMIHLLNQDVLFHSDIARDFLVLRDMVVTHKPTLIGPRAGGITGIFHGPLWYYISLLPFIVTRGNPVLMGWFWWILGIVMLVIYIQVAYKMTHNIVIALAAGILFAGIVFSNTDGIYNPFGAVALAGLLFYFIAQFRQSHSFFHAAGMWLLLGIITHFQMAFSLPLAVLLFPLFLFTILTTKRFLLSLSFLFFLLPLSTFVLFDIRHDWLQVRSLITFLTQPGSGTDSFMKILMERINGGFISSINAFSVNALMGVLIALFYFRAGYRLPPSTKNIVKLFLYLYLGWWLLTLFFSGTIQGYYYAAFVPMTILVFSLIASRSKLSQIIFVGLTCIALIRIIPSISYTPTKFNSSSWKLLNKIATDTLAVGDLGYFIYSQDQFGYPLKYAFLFDTNGTSHTISAFEKKPITALIKSADDPRNPYSTAEYWQKDRIKIEKPPIKSATYQNGYIAEIYSLTDEELAIPIDPNIITDLHFR